MQEIQWAHQKDPNATHQKLLYHVANLGRGKILEFGAGYYSTPILYKIAQDKRGRCMSFESNTNFVGKFFDDNNMHFTIMDVTWSTFFDSPLCQELVKLHWDLVFVDSSPWEARLTTIEHFKNCCDYLILHDCDYFLTTGVIKDWSEHFKYYQIYVPPKPWPYQTGPPTLLASNTIPEVKLKIDGMVTI